MRFFELTESSYSHDELERIHGDALEKTGFWGNAGAGCVFLAKSTGRLLLCHRSEDVEQPHTWGNWGGAIDPDESPEEAVQREAYEETGKRGPFEAIPLYVFSSGTFRYFNFLVVVEEEFSPLPGWESQGFAWVKWGEWPSPLHFGLQALFADQQSVEIIQREIREALTESEDLYYVQPDGTWKKNGDRRSKGRTRSEVETQGGLIKESLLYQGKAKFEYTEIDFTIYENPTRGEFQGLMRKSEHHALRGLWDDHKLYIWDASLATHGDVHKWADTNIGMWIDGADIEFYPSSVVMNSFYPSDNRGNLSDDESFRQSEALKIGAALRNAFAKYYAGDFSITLKIDGGVEEYPG